MAGDNSALQRRALAALILAESQRDGGRQGTRLPTERQLALDLGVSRSAIRHAMTLLQAEGHVSREVGRGTFLRGVPDPGADGPAAAPAAPGAPDTPVPQTPAADDYAPADVMTVRRLFEPTAMSLVVAWATARDLDEMDRCLRGGERATDHDEFEVDEYRQDHGEIVTALRLRDADRATAAMRNHLARVSRHLLGTE
jgi:DNA-binding FadR family transcriptional regulator